MKFLRRWYWRWRIRRVLRRLRARGIVPDMDAKELRELTRGREELHQELMGQLRERMAKRRGLH